MDITELQTCMSHKLKYVNLSRFLRFFSIPVLIIIKTKNHDLGFSIFLYCRINNLYLFLSCVMF